MLLAALAAVPATPPTCPPYGSIQQPSVRQGAFHPAELAGVWYMVGTTEPTLPTFCTCGVNTIEVHAEGGTYNYQNIDWVIPLKSNITIPIKGKLSPDPTTPGFLHETFGPGNSTHGLPLLPNMVFDVQRNESGAIDVVFTYACLGKVPPLVGKELFSFNILARSNRATRSQIEALAARANATTGGVLEMGGLRVNDVDAYHACGML